ncbi:MAG: ABC transporter ATP-binding protein [Armatimonadota bacterium]|nr:ABC transporter ATP-binding protein [Armatimonadota bacterium]MDR7486005.1 ABC transporter ATP-binding protein [Armatimonadota bacterium]MDR7532576.1 ABC transporter ATP-binding protein [Armatimonadota bacterium]MDR7536215.1 ABC transporter ATP-binding protein [Armatimonadota bacterium]
MSGPPAAAAGEGRPLLAVDRVSHTFGGLHALRDVSLAVRPGQIKALIGPNGAGKTTLFNLITGVLAPQVGRITFLGQPLFGLPPYRIATLGIARTFQNVRLFPGMTVFEHVLVGCHRHLASGLADAVIRSRRMRREEAAMSERAHRLLERVALARWAHVPADSLPFGLQRVVELARALATAPHLLLLDEPAAGLTPTEKAQISRLIRTVRDDGVTIFLVEHDMDLVMGLADEVAVLDQGALIADGPPAAVQADPRVIAAYLGDVEPADMGPGAGEVVRAP